MVVLHALSSESANVLPPHDDGAPKPHVAIEQTEWWDERALITAFAMRWAPFGGGNSEDIWMLFGITEQAYFARLRALLDSDHAIRLNEHVAGRLRMICADRLEHAPCGASPQTK